MPSIESIEAAATRLREAAETKKTCAPVRDLIGSKDLNAAYQVQEINSQRRKATGAKVIGYKIGLTAPVVQKQLGVDQPDFGKLWDDKEVLLGGEISMSELMQPKVEAEIAFVMGKDLDSSLMSTVSILNAVEYAVLAIEIVGSRIFNWDIRITDTIADNASGSHWLIGHKPVKLENLDLLNCKMWMENNDKLVSKGLGKACLGSPINALSWLAKKMFEMGEPLKAGDLILSGAVGPMVNAAAGDHFSVSIEGLGSASLNFVQ